MKDNLNSLEEPASNKLDKVASDTTEAVADDTGTTTVVFPKPVLLTDDTPGEFFGNRYKFLAGIANIPTRLVTHWYLKAHGMVVHDPSAPLPATTPAEVARAEADKIVADARAEAAKILADAQAAVATGSAGKPATGDLGPAGGGNLGGLPPGAAPNKNGK